MLSFLTIYKHEGIACPQFSHAVKTLGSHVLLGVECNNIGIQLDTLRSFSWRACTCSCYQFEHTVVISSNMQLLSVRTCSFYQSEPAVFISLNMQFLNFSDHTFSAFNILPARPGVPFCPFSPLTPAPAIPFGPAMPLIPGIPLGPVSPLCPIIPFSPASPY